MQQGFNDTEIVIYLTGKLMLTFEIMTKQWHKYNMSHVIKHSNTETNCTRSFCCSCCVVPDIYTKIEWLVDVLTSCKVDHRGVENRFDNLAV